MFFSQEREIGKIVMKTAQPSIGGRPIMMRVRSLEAAVPSGCRWCSRERGDHGFSYAASAGYHRWCEPTSQQRLARMQARRHRGQ